MVTVGASRMTPFFFQINLVFAQSSIDLSWINSRLDSISDKKYYGNSNTVLNKVYATGIWFIWSETVGSS